MTKFNFPNEAERRKKHGRSVLPSDVPREDCQNQKISSISELSVNSRPRRRSGTHGLVQGNPPEVTRTVATATPSDREGDIFADEAMKVVPPAARMKTGEAVPCLTHKTAVRKRPVVVSNLTISHALIESPSCYYEGPLPPIDFELSDSDILVAPRRLIKCDHTGTLHWIQKFTTVLHFYINYPLQRELVINNVVRQLPGNLYVLQDHEWKLLIHKDEQSVLFHNIVEDLVQFQRQRRTPAPATPGYRQEMGQEADKMDSYTCQKGDDMVQEMSHEYWKGLIDDYLLEKDSDRVPNVICENDVLLSQRALWKKHFGTVWFGHQMRQSLTRDDGLDQIVRDLIKAVNQRGGRFFELSLTASKHTWRIIEHEDELLHKVQRLWERMQWIDRHAIDFPVEGVQPHDVILSVSQTFFNHYGTCWFVSIMLRLKEVFTKAEVGYVLARKVREEVVSRRGRFFSSKHDDPVNSLQVVEDPTKIELSIVRLLEYMEMVDMKNGFVKTVQFDYPLSSRHNLNPPPDHSDVFMGGPWLTSGELATKPPGNIRLLRMIQDRSVLCPQADYTNQASDVIFRVHSHGGRFLRQQEESGWQVEKDFPTLLSLVMSTFRVFAKTGSHQDTAG